MMEFKQYFQLVWRWSWFIVLCAALAGMIAFGVSRTMVPIYQASTTLVVKTDVSRTESIYDAVLTSERLTKIYAELPHKRPVLEAVIANLQLNIGPESLADKLRVTVNPDTLFIVLTVEDASPQQAANIANAMVMVLSGQGSELLGSRYTAANFSLNVVEAAQPAQMPIRPRPLRNALLAAIVGAMLVLGVAFLMEYLDDTVKTSQDIDRLIGVSTLAAIAPMRGWGAPGKLVTVSEAHAPISEAYRALRAHIEFAAVERPIRTLVVTSSAPHEGKSTTIVNLAVVLAQAGKRIILVDTDLRRPTLHTFFRQPNAIGVTTALCQRGGTSIADHLVATGVGNLRLMPSGPLPSNPAELLGPHRMAGLIAELTAHADMVLFDSPALLAVIDATLLAGMCDATVLVVQAGSTKTDALVEAGRQLQLFGIPLLGAVLNRAATSRERYIAYYNRGWWRRHRQGEFLDTRFPSYDNGRIAPEELSESSRVVGGVPD